jgi:hypothetical protein
MIRMIATTISSSISEKPFCFRISKSVCQETFIFKREGNVFANKYQHLVALVNF